MAAVSVDQGMPGPEESAHKVDRSRWQLLAMARRRWAEIDLPFDCRLLRTVVDEAPMLAEGLGMESGDQFLTDYLSLDLDLVGRVLGWLEQEQPTDAVPLALAAAKAQPLAAHRRPTAEEQEGKGSDRTYTARGETQAYLLRRLARDAPEVLERVKSGEIKSARAAAIEAGIIKPVPTVRLVPDPTRAAASIVERMDRTWCVALATAIAEQIRDVACRPPP
jgi:hypothetical protein